MYQQFYDGGYEAFMAELTGGGREVGLAEVAVLVKRYLGDLKEWVAREGFASEAEEVYCFKVAKPRLHSWLIYYVEVDVIERRVPAGNTEVLNHYYLEELRMVERYLQQVAFFHQYYRSGATELDGLCFMRGKSLDGLLLPGLPEPDPAFSTYADYTFAKIMAYERLKAFLLEAVCLPDLGQIGDQTKLRWTGDMCSLVELIYGLHDTGQLNNGEAELQDIVAWLENSLKINLSRFYRRFMEIKERKMVSKTKFLDSMRDAINKRIDDDLAWRPGKHRRRFEGD
ncbi:MAG: RteC domain-containing protein [Bacteroidota bacterium]